MYQQQVRKAKGLEEQKYEEWCEEVKERDKLRSQLKPDKKYDIKGMIFAILIILMIWWLCPVAVAGIVWLLGGEPFWGFIIPWAIITILFVCAGNGVN